ncbi:hypothetical protein Pint_03838 [Pistacia integerrima]|uniref:Uncharacterized protein n=1 Tax=Pistacia integerrima TaxID=434235 RepID=A0ACC0Z5E1_9ROSI|nr:hypothetical protein Pint_03838 [Pistacia integerrima]
MDPISIDSFARFIRTRFQRLDILVNNAGISGAIFDTEAFISLNLKSGESDSVNPGFVRTDLSHNLGQFTVEEGARGPVMLAFEAS